MPMHDGFTAPIRAPADAPFHRRRRRAFALLLSVALCAAQAHADQYHSEERVLPNAPQAATPSPQQQLATTRDPYARAMLLRELAAQAARQKNYPAAANYLQQALALNALSAPAQEQMRKDLLALRIGSGADPQAVVAALEPSYRAHPELPPDQLAALGGAYLQLKRPRDALAPLQRAVAAVRSAPLAWRRALYAAYLETGAERDAVNVLETVVRDDPAAREDWLRLAALHLKLGDESRAQAVMAVMARLGYLAQAEQRLQLVELTARIGAPFEAGSLLKDWMARGEVPRNPETLRLQATLWVRARESALAIPALEDALKAMPADKASAPLWLQLGQLEMDREDYARAAQALEKALAAGARSGAVWMALGMARYQQADIEGAIKAFAAAQNDAANRKLAGQWLQYLQSGKAREQALAAAEQTRVREPGAPQLAGLLSGPTVSLEGAPDSGVLPAVAPEVAASRGGLTPVGAEQAGNREGTIPPWTGGLTRAQWPADYRPGGRLRDPFPGDRPLFVITAANAAQYAAHLADGYKALFRRFPDYQMKVYATRRTVAYPPAIDAATQANVGKAHTLAADSIAGARLGFPFPEPRSGVEILWNHRLRYRGDTVQSQSTQAVVGEQGVLETYKQTEKVYFRYGNIADPVDLSKQNILLYYLTWFGKGAHDIDFVALVHETANQLEDARGVWVIPPHIPRLFRIPPVGYDQPFPDSGGLYFIDMVDMYNGPFDRYVWKLVGKRELYIPYNDYRVSDGRYRYAQLLTPNHFNQDPVRYELHRVWVVEATLRPGNHHSFGKRVFYVDEDSWNVVLVENYDPQGNLWRFQEGHLLPDYGIQAANCAPVVTYDFKKNEYFANRLYAEDPPPIYDQPMQARDFMPATVRARYVR